MKYAATAPTAPEIGNATRTTIAEFLEYTENPVPPGGPPQASLKFSGAQSGFKLSGLMYISNIDLKERRIIKKKGKRIIKVIKIR